ncbi:MAG: DUF1579 domain-containing protein [Phycisphaerales bacterium]|nr:DUF1579 domain-containing protein [Phycisphaerales bacterium]MCB9835839.1 DUF1579 domain-containing protein [Phycisphaera sp.]
MNMKKAIGVGALVVGAAACGAWGAANIGQPEGEHPGKKYVEEFMAKVSDPNMMANYMKAGEPGTAHEFLALFTGEFDTTSRMWMDPAAEPMESTGSCTNTMIMDGRYLKTEYEGNIMGVPFTGFAITGYDNNRKLFTNVWIDSMSTGIAPAWGNLDQTGTVMTLVGTMDEPTTGEIGKLYKQVFRIVDEDHYVMEMWEILYGDEFKVMEIAYSRKG